MGEQQPQNTILIFAFCEGEVDFEIQDNIFKHILFKYRYNIALPLPVQNFKYVAVKEQRDQSFQKTSIGDPDSSKD